MKYPYLMNKLIDEHILDNIVYLNFSKCRHQYVAENSFCCAKRSRDYSWLIMIIH